MPLSVAGHGHRVDREHFVSRRYQCGHPRASFGLDADLHHASRLARFSSSHCAEGLADSVDNHTKLGVWGGMTERLRPALLNRRPEVVSWRGLFEADRMREQRHAS